MQESSEGVRRGAMGEMRVERVLLRPEEAAQALGVSRTTVFELMRSGALRSVKIGAARRVSATALAEFVAALEAA
jgi:excisionase family DNA binding protein